MNYTGHFSREALRALARQGVTVIRPVDGKFFVDDNGTGRVWTFREVLTVALSRVGE